MKPILLFGTQMAVGGAQKALLDLASWFHQKGYPVKAAFFYDRDQLYPSWQQKYPFEIIDLKGRGDKNTSKPANFWNALRGLFRLYRLMRREHFSSMLAFTHHANLLGIPPAWLAGIPLRVASHHGRIETMPSWQERIHTWLVNSRLTTALVVVSERVHQQVLQEGVRPERIIMIPNGIEIPGQPGETPEIVRQELKVKENGFLVLSVGRLVPVKGHTFLLQAAQEVLQKYPHTVFAIAGDGPLKHELETETLQLGIQDSVRLLGSRSDVPALLAAADLFVQPSRSEGLPFAVLEAMGMEKPVVSTCVPGVVDLIRDGQNGLIVPLEDPQSLAEAILQLIPDEEKRRRMARAAKAEILEHYTLEKMSRQYEQLLVRQ